MSLNQKIFNAKKEIGKISKDSTNPFFKSKYFDINSLLEHVEPILQKNDLLLLQPIANGLVFTQIVDVETGDLVESGIELPNLSDPQKLGSAITYYRRYTLQSLLGLQAEDDDANKASGNVSKPNKQETDKEWLNVGDRAWNRAIAQKLPLSEVRKHYKVSKANAAKYEEELTK